MTDNHSRGKESILHAATLEFAERGYEGARVDAIAARAEVNKALIYYHFKNKEELFRATIDSLFSKSIPKSFELSGITIKDKFMYMLAQYITFLHENPVFVKLMDQAVKREEHFFSEIAHQNTLFITVFHLYQEGVEKGEFRHLQNPIDYLVSLLGACYFFCSHRNAVSRFYPKFENEKELLQMRIQTLHDIAARIFFI